MLWVLPPVTWYPLVTRVRDDPLRNTRSTAAGLLARVFLAPYWVNYHLEQHHLLVFVPCCRPATST